MGREIFTKNDRYEVLGSIAPALQPEVSLQLPRAQKAYAVSPIILGF
jgi:hypothetical protein